MKRRNKRIVFNTVRLYKVWRLRESEVGLSKIHKNNFKSIYKDKNLKRKILASKK